MIEYLKGTLADLSPALAIVECHGVGYGVNISLNTFSAIQGKQEVKLWISESIREDAYQLWGFSTRAERELFLLLLGVSGIGAATCRVILSSMTVAELAGIISEGNDKVLKRTGMAQIMWSLDTEDWKTRDADATFKAIKNTKNLDGKIVLMHSIYDSTAEATEMILPWLKENGYQTVTVSELIKYRTGKPPQPGKVYKKVK